MVADGFVYVGSFCGGGRWFFSSVAEDFVKRFWYGLLFGVVFDVQWIVSGDGGLLLNVTCAMST